MSKNEKVKKRKSYYGFAQNYPGRIGTKNYAIGDTLEQRRRESRRRITIVVLLILLFIASFMITSICFEISKLPM
mgnify:CR=1 FL=1|jgi:hypothetical protein